MRARLVLVVGFWLFPVLVSAGPAAAMTCVRLDDRAYRASAAAVFSGEVIAYEEVGDPRLRGTAVVTFAVDRVFKGKLEPTVKVGYRDLYSAGPRTGRFLIYADEIGSGRDLVQFQVVRLDRELDDLQKPLREIEARLNGAPDSEARAQQQTARVEEADRIQSQSESLERARNDLTEQLTSGALRDVTLAWNTCSGSRLLAQTSDKEHADPIVASLGKGVAPRGIDTDDPPAPPTSLADRLAPWWPVGLGTTLVGLGTGILTQRRRRARASGDARSTP